MVKVVIFVVGLVVACGACSKRKPGQTEDARVEAPPAAARDARVAEPAASSVSEQEARAWLTGWLEAQNSGDFPRYAACYADTFAGVRRSKGKIVELDHAGWLADRKRMFRKPMEVTARDVTFASPGGRAELRFVQVWKSGTYADKGEKLVVLARGDQGVHAVREAMLSSHPLEPKRTGPPAATPRVFAVARFYPGQQPGLLLPSTWGWVHGVQSIGKPEAVLSPAKEVVGVRRRLDAATLPPEYASLRGTSVELMTGAGTRACTATIAELFHADAFGAERAVYVGAYYRDRWQKLAADNAWDELGAAVWEHTQHRVTPMASLSALDGDCGTAMWARLPAATAVSVAVAVDDSALENKVGKQIWQHPAYEEYSAKYELEQPAVSREEWDEDLELSIEVSLWGLSDETPVLAVLHTDIADLIYAVAADGSLSNARDATVCAKIIGALDADADGTLDLLSATGFGAGCLDLSGSDAIGF